MVIWSDNPTISWDISKSQVAQLSTLILDVTNDAAFTASLGNLFQFLTTLRVKNFFLISDLKGRSPW